MTKAKAKRAFPRTMNQAMLLIVLAVLFPMLLAQVGIYTTWFFSQRNEELATNLEVGRSLAIAFRTYLRDIWREELAIGIAVKNLEPYSVERANQVLAANAREYYAIRSWHWADPAGTIVASTKPAMVGQKIDDRAYFHQLQAGQETALSDLLSAKDTGLPAFVIARRINDERGDLRGVVLAVVEPEKLAEFVLPVQREEGGVFTVFDRQGSLVFISQETTLQFSNWREVDEMLDAALRDKSEQAGMFYSPADGLYRLGARVPVADIGWIVGASRPVAVAMEPVARSLLIAAGTNLLVFVASLLGAKALSRRIVDPVQRLQEHAQAVGEGHLERRVEEAGIEELSHLAEAFNRMAERLEKHKDELDRTIDELTRSNRELEQFAYVASHDLQEPLRVITGYVQLLERRYRDKLDADAEQFIDYTVAAVKQLQQLIHDLLEYSRVGTRGKPAESTNMEEVLQQTAWNLAATIEETGAKVTHDPLPVIHADRGQMIQLLQNLLGNAIKFRGDRRPEIHISVQRSDDQWCFSVRDNGIGIEKQYWDRVFLIFQRLHTRKQYSGTGIGLAVCKRIVERHGGRIWVQSQPGQGAIFFFTLAA